MTDRTRLNKSTNFQQTWIIKQTLWIFKCAARNSNSSTRVKAWLFPWLSLLPPPPRVSSSSPQSGSQEAASSWIHLLPHGKSVRACFTLCLPVAPSGNKAVKIMAAQINGWSIKLTRPHHSIRFFLAGADAEAWDQPQRCQDPAASRRDI